MDVLTLREAGPSDMAAVAELLRAYAAELAVDLAPQGFAAELAGLPGAYAPPGGAILLAGTADMPAAGCICLRPLDESIGEVKRLYVRPAARGAGIGRALVSGLIAIASRRGYRELKLDTLVGMQAAIDLYQSFGFRPIPPYGSHPYADLVCLGLRLSI